MIFLIFCLQTVNGAIPFRPNPDSVLRQGLALRATSLDSSTQCLFEAANQYDRLVKSQASPSLWGKRVFSLGALAANYAEQLRYVEADSVIHVAMGIAQIQLTAKDTNTAHIWMAAGLNHSAQGKYPKAMSAFKQAKEIFQTIEPRPSAFPWLLYHEGRVYTQMGDYEKARSLFTQAIEESLVLAPDTSLQVANIYNGLAVLEEIQGNFSAARKGHQQAIQIKEKHLPSDHAELATSYANLGMVYFSEDRLKLARHWLERALKIMEQHYEEESMPLTTTYNQLGLVAEESGYYEDALSYYFRALDIRRKILPSGHPSFAYSYNNLASLYGKIEDFDKAIFFSKKELDNKRLHLPPNHVRLAFPYFYLGEVYLKKKDFPTAEKYLTKCLKLIESNLGPDNLNLVPTLNNLAKLAIATDKPGNAQSLLNRSLSIRKAQLGDPHPLTARSYLDLGELAKKQGQYQTAIRYFQRALPVLSENRAKQGGVLTEALVLLAESYRYAGEVDSAILAITEGLTLVFPDYEGKDLAQIPTASLRISNLKAGFKLLYLRGNYWRLKKGKTKSILPGKVADAHFQASIDLLLKKLAKFDDHFIVAAYQDQYMEVFEAAIDNALRLSKLENETFWLQKAFSYLEQSKGVSLNFALQGLEASYSLRIDPRLKHAERTLFERAEELNQALNQYNYQSSEEESTQEVKLREELLETQRSLDSLQAVVAAQYPAYELMKYNQKAPDLGRIFDFAREEEVAILTYFWGKKQIIAFVVGKSGLRVLQIPISDHLTASIDTLRSLISRPPSAEKRIYDQELRAFADAGSYLYEQLVAPFLPSLSPVSSCVISPAGPLYNLPWEVLLTSASGSNLSYKTLPYLGFQKAIYYTQALKFLPSRTRGSRFGMEFYAGFAPTYESDPPLANLAGEAELLTVRQSAMKPLAYNIPEVVETAKKLDGVAFIGPEATEQAFKSVAQKFQILHLAMHAIADNRQPAYSGLIFTKLPQEIPDSSVYLPSLLPLDSFEREDGVLHSFELYHMGLRSNLAILSACNTGYGEVLGGEGMISLAQAFRYAGCPSIMPTLWQVDDRSMHELIDPLITHLQSGLPKHEALRQAKLHYLRYAPESQSHPYYWASLILMGQADPLPPKAWYLMRPVWVGFLALIGCICILLLRFGWLRQQTA